jgi:hypothetical protein
MYLIISVPENPIVKRLARTAVDGSAILLCIPEGSSSKLCHENGCQDGTFY